MFIIYYNIIQGTEVDPEGSGSALFNSFNVQSSLLNRYIHNINRKLVF